MLLGLPALQSELRDKHTDPPPVALLFAAGLLSSVLGSSQTTPGGTSDSGGRHVSSSLPVPLPMLAGTPTASTNQSTNQSYRFLRNEAIDVFTWR